LCLKQDKQLLIAVRDLFAAGTETSSSTVVWIILALLHHPEHQAKIVEEIDRVLGKNIFDKFFADYRRSQIESVKQHCASVISPFAQSQF